MPRASLGRRLTVSTLLLLVGFAAVSMAVLVFGQATVQRLVSERLETNSAASRERQSATTAKVRDEALHQAEQALRDKLTGMAGLIAGASASAMVTEDYGVVEDGCRNAVADPDAAWAFVTKADGTAVAEAVDASQQADLVAAGISAGAPSAARRSALATVTATGADKPALAVERASGATPPAAPATPGAGQGLMLVTRPIQLDGKAAGMVSIVATLSRLAAQRSAINERFSAMDASADRDMTQLHDSLVAAQENAGRHLLLTLAGASGIALVIGLLLTLRLTRSITRPLGAVGTVTHGLADGDLTQRVTVGVHDEVGAMAEALNTSLGHLQQAVQGISGTAGSLGGAADQLGGISAELTRQAASSSAQAQQVAAGTQELSQALSTVAAGVTELNSSVDEIARNAQQAADVGGEAVAITGVTTKTMSDLARASDEIRGIVQTIAKIASRTNLLALNATIEAASAGEAGRGFAVVANEVKELARQTATATRDITDKVSAIASGSAAASEAIARIADIVERINHLQQSIASAVTEQAATTRELSGTVQQAAENSEAIAASITVVASAAEATTSGAGRASEQAAELARLAEELRVAVGRFRC
jgi:methyl-accepting chemotaxis protein